MAAAPPPTGVAPPPFAAAPTTGMALRPIPLAAAAVAGLTALLPWFDFMGETVNGFDIEANFLVDYKTTADHPFTVGVLVLAFAVLAAAASVLAQPTLQKMLRPAGIGLVVVGVLFIVSTFRLANANTGISATDLLGYASYLAIIAGGVFMRLEMLRQKERREAEKERENNSQNSD